MPLTRPNSKLTNDDAAVAAQIIENAGIKAGKSESSIKATPFEWVEPSEIPLRDEPLEEEQFSDEEDAEFAKFVDEIIWPTWEAKLKAEAANDNQAPASEERAYPEPEPDRLIKATPFVLRDPVLIPRREFLYGSHYIRKYLSATFGAGGGGKSAHAVTEALAMVTGRPLLSDNLTRPIRVWYVNVEDPADEIERRFAAAAKHFSITTGDIGGRLFADSGRDQGFVIAREGNSRKTEICAPVVEALVEEINARNIDVLIVDPFVSTHEVDEKDNTKIQIVAATWTQIAQGTNCAIELIHHVRKTADEITADDGRGAGSLKDKARSVRVINRMQKSQAEEANLDPKDAGSYFSVGFSKTNLTKGGRLAWRHFAPVKLGNGGKGNLAFLEGDEIGVVERWEWPAPNAQTDAIEPDVLERIKARLGMGDYRESAQSEMWAGHIIAEILEIDARDKSVKKRIKQLIAGWVEEGHLAIEQRQDKNRMPRPCIVPVYATP